MQTFVVKSKGREVLLNVLTHTNDNVFSAHVVYPNFDKECIEKSAFVGSKNEVVESVIKFVRSTFGKVILFHFPTKCLDIKMKSGVGEQKIFQLEKNAIVQLEIKKVTKYLKNPLSVSRDTLLSLKDYRGYSDADLFEYIACILVGVPSFDEISKLGFIGISVNGVLINI